MEVTRRVDGSLSEVLIEVYQAVFLNLSLSLMEVSQKILWMFLIRFDGSLSGGLMDISHEV